MRNRKVQRGRLLEMVTEEVTLPNGQTTHIDVIHHPGASAVVPFLSPDEVLLIRQYRHAVGDYIYEIPAGKLDPGEDPEACATRELEEETGRRAGRLESLGRVITTPGFTDEVVHLFAAFELTPGEQNLGDSEMIELVPMRFESALDLIWAGELPDAKSGLALLHAAHRLRQWG